MAWSKLASDTLGSAGDQMTISFVAKKFIVFLQHFWAVTDIVTPDLTLDDTAGDDYARRNSTNGGADTTLTSQALIENGLGGIGTTAWQFTVDYMINIDSEEKLGIYFCIAGTNGATNAPSRAEGVFKKDTTTDTAQFTKIDIDNTEAGNFEVGSNIIGIGTD